MGGGVLKKCDFKKFDAAVMPPISGWTKFREHARKKRGKIRVILVIPSLLTSPLPRLTVNWQARNRTVC